MFEGAQTSALTSSGLRGRVHPRPVTLTKDRILSWGVRCTVVTLIAIGGKLSSGIPMTFGTIVADR